MSKPQIEVSLTADLSGLQSGFQKAASMVKSGAKEMESHFAPLQAIAGSLFTPIVAFAGALGSAKFLQGTVEATKSWTGESMKLARVLGITTEAASVLNVALGDIYVDSEDLFAATSKLTKALGGHEEAFRRLGVSTRDQNGHFRDTPAILADVNAALLKIKSGTDRNVATQLIYGKSWLEAQKILKLTPEIMEEARKKAEKLNLIVGADSVEATKAYKASMNELEDVVRALKVGIGRELMPVVTQFNNDIAQAGPSAVGILGGALNGLYQGVLVGREIFEKFIVYWEYGWKIAAVSALNAVEQINMVLTGRLGEAFAKERNLGKELAPIVREQTKALGEIEADYAEKSAKLWGDIAAKKAKASEKNQNAFDGGKDSETTLARLKADLELERALYQAQGIYIVDVEQSKATRSLVILGERVKEEQKFQSFSKEQEAAWLKANTKLYGLNAKERFQIDQEQLKLQSAIGLESFEAQNARLQTALEAARNDGAERIRIAEAVAARETKGGTDRAKQAEAAKQAVIRIRREVAQEEEQIQDLQLEGARAHEQAISEMQKDEIKQRVALGEISVLEGLRQTQVLEQADYERSRRAIEVQRDNSAKTLEQRQKLSNDLQALDDAYGRKRIEAKAAVDAELRKTDGLAGWTDGLRQALEQGRNYFEQFKQVATSVVSGVTSAFSAGLEGILSGQMTLGQGLKSIWQGILSTIIKALAQLAAQHIVTAAVKAALRKKEQATASGVAIASQHAAAAETWAAYAGIPGIGPSLAMAQIALMNASLLANLGGATAIGATVTALAVGSRITSPTLALMGEAGPEIVAPEHNFLDWATSLTTMGADLGATIARRQAATAGYGLAGAGYAAAAAAQGGRNVASGSPFVGGRGHVVVEVNAGLIAGEGAESGRIIANFVKKGLDDYNWSKG